MVTPLTPGPGAEEKRIPSKGWAAMIRKVYEVDPMICPKCGGTMKVVAFIIEHAVVDRIIDHRTERPLTTPRKQKNPIILIL
jgi:hypothetical protein